MLDLIEGFKYRKIRSWFILFVFFGILGMIGWLIVSQSFALSLKSTQTALLVLLYFPLLFMLMLNFRACVIYSFRKWKVPEEEYVKTRKDALASNIFWSSWIVFLIYGFVVICWLIR